MYLFFFLCFLLAAQAVIEDYSGPTNGSAMLVSLRDQHSSNSSSSTIEYIHICTSESTTIDINNCEAPFLVHTWADIYHYSLEDNHSKRVVSIDTSVAARFWDAKQMTIIIKMLDYNDTHIVRINPLVAQVQRLPEAPAVAATIVAGPTGVIISIGAAGIIMAVLTIAIVMVRRRSPKEDASAHIIFVDEPDLKGPEGPAPAGLEEDQARLLRMGKGASPAFLANKITEGV